MPCFDRIVFPPTKGCNKHTLKIQGRSKHDVALDQFGTLLELLRLLLVSNRQQRRIHFQNQLIYAPLLPLYLPKRRMYRMIVLSNTFVILQMSLNLDPLAHS